jgi:large subunit ribosomal protein L11
MAKKKGKAKVTLKLQITGGQANPAPPLGPALSQHRVNIGQFINDFNEKTRDQMGVPLPVEVSIFQDGSYRFDVKSPPASYLLKQAAQIAKGSGETGKEAAGSVTREQVREIVEKKMEDLNARDMEAAERIIMGTARSCGIEVIE